MPPRDLPSSLEMSVAMYQEAAVVASIAMGKQANEDPLAYWGLVELLVRFAARHGVAARREMKQN